MKIYEAFKVIVIGDINANQEMECYYYFDQEKALAFFGKRIGRVFSTLLAEDGFLTGITATAYDGTDFSDQKAADFNKQLKKFNCPDASDWNEMKFTGPHNYDLGSVVLLSYWDKPENILP